MVFNIQYSKEIKSHRHMERLITQLMDFTFKVRAFKTLKEYLEKTSSTLGHFRICRKKSGQPELKV